MLRRAAQSGSYRQEDGAKRSLAEESKGYWGWMAPLEGGRRGEEQSDVPRLPKMESTHRAYHLLGADQEILGNSREG